MENWKAVMFLLAFGQGIFLSFALIVKGFKRQWSNFFLGLILYTLALELLNAWGIQVQYHKSADAFPFWNFQTYLILPPSLWFFARFTTTPDYMFKRKYCFFYLPALIEITVRNGWSLYHYFTGKNLPFLLDIPVWFFVTEILPIISMAIVVWIYARKLLHFHQLWTEQSSRLNLLQYLRLYGLCIFLLALTLLWAAGVVLNLPVFATIEAILTVFLFVFGYVGYIDAAFFTLPVLAGIKPSEKPEFAHYDDERQLERLMVIFKEDAIYTQSKLNLEEVAGKLRLPPRYVSYLINTKCNSNFNNFINGFRVEEVIRKLNDPKEQHKTLLALALESGFNSKSTFNQVFKQHTGKSPSHYMMTQK